MASLKFGIQSENSRCLCFSSRCRRQLRKTLFYPEYVDMDREQLGAAMEEEMKKFIKEEMPSLIMGTVYNLCKECSSFRATSDVTLSATMDRYNYFFFMGQTFLISKLLQLAIKQSRWINNETVMRRNVYKMIKYN